MAKHISNIDELEKSLLPEMSKMVGALADRVYETLNYFLQEYYISYNPISYQRTLDLLHSAVKVEPKIIGNKVIASVYIDYESLNNYRNATGYEVVSLANKGLHGGLDVGENTPHIWDDTIENTINNGELLKLAIQYLKSKGFTVRA